MRTRLRLSAIVILLASVSYIAFLKNGIHYKESLILSMPQLICFFSALLFGAASILVLLADGVCLVLNRISRLRK